MTLILHRQKSEMIGPNKFCYNVFMKHNATALIGMSREMVAQFGVWERAWGLYDFMHGQLVLKNYCSLECCFLPLFCFFLLLMGKKKKEKSY